jgi:hypothetical protein
MAVKLRDYLNDTKSAATQAALLCTRSAADGEIYVVQVDDASTGSGFPSGGGGGGGGGDVNLTGINGTAPATNTGNATSGTQRVVLASNQPAVAVSASSLPLPSGAATETTLASIDGKTPSLGQANNANSQPVVISSQQTSTVPAARGAAGIICTPAQQTLFRTTFASVLANVDPTFFNTIQTGSGQGVSQSAGNLVLTTGTTANSETILRSTSSFSGSLIARIQTILSQRIANQNFFAELVDVIGDSLAVTVNSATSITVTIPSNPFTSVNVGQSMYIGAVQNISATAVPGRYAIASVAGNNVNFTVAGWPATGSGTCSLFGWNYYQIQYTGTTATNANYDAQRRGWATGPGAITINNTASPGHMVVMSNNDGVAYVSDLLVASATGQQTTQRGSRVINLPEENTSLFLQIRSVNGTAAPASTTTWTLGMASVENYAASSVVVSDVKAHGNGSLLPVSVVNTPSVTVSSGTITTVSTVSTVSTVTAAGLQIPITAADVASAALTTTTTTAAFTPGQGISYQVNIPVTAVTGTTPTLDVSIEESDDTGTNWFKVYDFPRITAVGMYRSPVITLNGNRVRYVQTVGGTTPSFTRAVNRLQSHSPGQFLRQLVNRTIDPNTLNSTSVAIGVGGCVNFNALIRCTAQTTAATITLQFSHDNVNWHTTGNTLATVVGIAHLKVQNEKWAFVRGIVSAAGTGITLAEFIITGSDK